MSEPLTRNQQKFAGALARETGLDPHVLGAWLKAEQSGSAAQSYEGKGYNNWLNIARTDSGDRGGAHSGVWSDPESAAKATAEWLSGRGRIAAEYGKPAQGIQNILRTRGQSAEAQIKAIAGSGWASSGYEGGNTLRTLYHELSGRQMALMSAAQRRAGAAAGIAPVVPEASTATAQLPPEPPPPNPIDALTAIRTGNTNPQIEKNWRLLKTLFDTHTPISQPHTGEPPAVQLPGEQRQAPVSKQAGVVHFENTPVAAWIAPILAYARQQGWKGKVTSGHRTFEEQTRIYNSGVRPAAVPGTSNHEGTQFPKGAVDVEGAEELSKILHASPYAHALVWAGEKDPVHFSHPHNGSY